MNIYFQESKLNKLVRDAPSKHGNGKKDFVERKSRNTKYKI